MFKFCERFADILKSILAVLRQCILQTRDSNCCFWIGKFNLLQKK